MNFGIFETKKAYNLAVKYGLTVYDKNGYIYQGDYVKYSDVKFIVDNLWHDHFVYNTRIPLNVTPQKYIKLYVKYN